MKTAAFCLILGTCSFLAAQDLGNSGPPYVEATETMPTKQINNPEKRCDMVTALAEKSQMNYRVLAMKIMEKWQTSIKSDKTFLKSIYKYKTISFTVHKDGSIEIKGVEDPPSGKKGSARGSSKAADNGQ